MYKKILAVLAISTIGMGVAFAQHEHHQLENKTPDEMAELKTERMVKRLDLTSDQAAKVYAIILKSATNRLMIQEKYPQGKEAEAEMNEFRKETKASVQAVLSLEQQAKVKEMHELGGMKRNNGSRNDDLSVDQRMERMKIDLDLTDSQVKKLTPVFEKQKAQRDEFKAKYPELLVAKKEMKRNREETEKQLESVLTPEQLEMMYECGPKNRKGCENGKKGMR